MPDPRVVEAMLPYFTERYGNAASRQHEFGWVAEAAVELARKQVARIIGATSSEIVFTSGATESLNIAILGVGASLQHRGRHLVTAVTEHRAVLDTVKHLEDNGFCVTRLPVDRYGLIDPDDLRKTIRKDTILVSIMSANNEIGTIASLRTIGEICREHGVLFHTDATQAVSRVSLNVRENMVDLLSYSAHKIHGPKGVGALFCRAGYPTIAPAPQTFGGGHERGLRSGTLNVPAIVGFGKAAELAVQEMELSRNRIASLRDRLVHELQKDLDDLFINGHPTERLVNNASITFPQARADSVIMEMKDVAVSTGAACSSATPEPSHVLQAIGLTKEAAASTLRFGLSKFTTGEEIDYVVARVVRSVKTVRTRSMAIA
jgi:cysteine desulfurase